MHKVVLSLTDLDAAFWDPSKLKNSKYTVLFLPESSHLVAQPQYLGQLGSLVVTVSKEGRCNVAVTMSKGRYVMLLSPCLKEGM